MIRKFWKKNRSFSILTVFLILAVLIILRYSTLPQAVAFLTFLSGPVPEDTIPYDLAIGYAASYFFYLIQVEIPQVRKEKKAYHILQNDIRQVIIRAALIAKILEKETLAEIALKKGKLPVYRYKINQTFTENEHFPIAKDAAAPANQDGFYNFLWKANYDYEKLKNQVVFQNLNECIIEQIIGLNIPYWFQTYSSILAAPGLYAIPNAQIQIGDAGEREKLKKSLMEAESILKISITIDGE